jgi:type II secretory pathway component PulM
MNIQERIDRLAPRERQLLGVMLAVALVMVVFLIPVGVGSVLASRRGEIDELQESLDRIRSEQTMLQRIKQEKNALLAKYRSSPPALAGFLSKLASANGIEIPEIKDRAPVLHGKKFEEQSVELTLKKVGLISLSKFLEGIVKDHPISVGKLNIRTRGAQPDSYDVTLTVSAYRRLADEKPAKKAGGG